MRKLFISILVFGFLFSGCVSGVKIEKNNTPKTETVKKEKNIKETSQKPEKEISEKDDESIKPEEKKEDETTKPEKTGVLLGKVIVVDPGHGVNSYTKQEPIAPDSSETKSAFVSGTRGKNITEEQLNLMVALKLQRALQEKGAQVHMTRTVHNCDVSNIDRAVFANDLNADISVKLHADGNDNTAVRGVSMLIPGGAHIKDATVIEKSRKAGTMILEEFVRTTGAQDRGISVRNDMTGFNWSKVPVILLEMGFMTNPDEDKLMESDEYQEKMVAGIVAGLERYFSDLQAQN